MCDVCLCLSFLLDRRDRGLHCMAGWPTKARQFETGATSSHQTAVRPTDVFASARTLACVHGNMESDVLAHIIHKNEGWGKIIYTTQPRVDTQGAPYFKVDHHTSFHLTLPRRPPEELRSPRLPLPLVDFSTSPVSWEKKPRGRKSRGNKNGRG